MEAQGVVTGARCNGNTCQNLTGLQVQVTGNEAAKTINILATPGGTLTHSWQGASIGLNGASLGTIDVGPFINKTNRNILWLHNSTLTNFTNNGRLTSGTDGQAINLRVNSSITNFTNNGTITGSSGVWMQNGSITTLTNNANATINSNATNGRFGAIEVVSASRIDTFLGAEPTMLNQSKLFTSLALAPLLLSVDVNATVIGATLTGNTYTNTARARVYVTGNESNRDINVVNSPLGTSLTHAVTGASIGLNWAQLGGLSISNAINQTNRNVVWLDNSNLTNFTNAGILTSNTQGQAVNLRGNTSSSITNFTNNGTITGSSGVWMQNGSITTLTNNANATINSNATNGRYGAIDLNSNASITNLINNGSISNTANANTQALRVLAGASVGTIENQGTGTIVGISTAARGRVELTMLNQTHFALIVRCSIIASRPVIAFYSTCPSSPPS